MTVGPSVRRARPEQSEGSAGGVVEVVGEWLDDLQPGIAIVLGSGLSGLAAAVSETKSLEYREIPEFPVSAVEGHAGKLIAGTLEGVPVVLQNGRFHLYEGHAPSTVALPVRVFAQLGVTVLVVTNAAGGIRATMRPPTLMLIADHLNLMWRNPLIGPVQEGEERFPDMSEPYDRELRVLARDTARAEGIALEEGVYAGVLGPSYETPAEIRMLQRLGADAVGMSTVPEVIAARARGMRVLGFSSVTNVAAGLSSTPVLHDDVLRAGMILAGDLEKVVRGVIRQIGG